MTVTTDPDSLRRRWLREPLLHFFLLGVLIFSVDYLVVARTEDPNKIVVTAEIDREARALFASSRGREPNEEELRALRQIWLDNEVLYREGLALQVDKGDEAIRERVIFKALAIIEANLKQQTPGEEALREWFEARRDKYDEPARYDFQEAVISDHSEEAVRAFVERLNHGAPGDAEAGLRVFNGRPYQNLVQSYGAEFPAALEALPTGKWHAVHTSSGWRAMQVDSIAPAKPATFEVMAGVVFQDWKDANATEQRTAAVRALAKNYRIEIEGETP